jgi:hypothetical protein
MTGTAELIARLRATFKDRDGETAPLAEEAALALAAQAQEIAEQRERADTAEDHVAEEHRRAQAAEALARLQRDTVRERETLLEEAEARMRELERKIEVQEMAMDTARSIWEQRIERCAKVADRIDSVNGIGDAIRALKEPTAAPPTPAESGKR